VLNRAVWSSLAASRILLGLLVGAFAPTGPLVVGIAVTLERRRGPKIAAAGIHRDPVRSSHSHVVKVRAALGVHDAAGPDPPPPRQPHQKGRPRVVGRRLPTLAACVTDPTTAWTRVRLPRWSSEDNREVDIVSGDGALVSQWQAPRADPLGADPRSPSRLPHPSLALYRPGGDPRADPLLVRLALGDQGLFW